MKGKKRIVSFLLLMTMLVSNIVIGGFTASAADVVQVVLDGKALQFDVPPIIKNDRLLVPFRIIGEEMGAVVAWDAATKKVTMTLGSDYVQLQVGNNIMTYGQITADQNGQMQFLGNTPYQLDAAPEIIDGRTLVPTRAIAEGLGATVSYEASTKIVFITSNTRTPSEPVQQSTAAPKVDPVFSDTDYFQEISGKRAQDMYELGIQNQYNFALVYYDSQDSGCREAIPGIKDAAERAGFKVYGVDVHSTKNQNLSNLKFIWNYVDESEIALPTLFLSYSNDSVMLVTDFARTSEVERRLSNLAADVYATPTPTPNPEATPTPTPSPTPVTVSFGSYWHYISKTDIHNRYYNGDKFIFVFYDSKRSGYQDSLRAIQTAVGKAKVDVYYGDYDSSDNSSWFGSELLGTPEPNPTIFFVSGVNAFDFFREPTDADMLEREINSFANY